MVLLVTKIIGSMVIKNEKDRYLEDCINHAFTFLDEIFVYDDRSEDDSAEIARDLGCRVVVRPDNESSFLDHEGQFRYSAWRSLEQIIEPDISDWIFSFDADEFMVAESHVEETLHNAVSHAESNKCISVILPFSEIFRIDEQGLWARTDGLWNTIRGPRLFKYNINGYWNNKPMGCGAEPDYVSRGRFSHQNYGLNVLHLGYAKDEDKKEKYTRYSSLSDHGHNNSHILSILTEPTLQIWTGKTPNISMGGS